MAFNPDDIFRRWKSFGTRIALQSGDETLSFEELSGFRSERDSNPRSQAFRKIREYLLHLRKGSVYAPSGEVPEIPASHLQHLNGHSGLLLQTTGTRGNPRQVLLHAGELLYKYLPLRTAHRAALVFSLDHISGWESLWSVLVPGGTMLIPEEEDWKNFLENEKPELLSCTPSWLYFKFQYPGATAFQSVKYINLGGEPCSASLLEYFRKEAPHILFRNAFGTTETGNFQTIHRPGGYFFPGKKEAAAFKAEDGFLFLRKPAVHPGPLDMHPAVEWIPTGDRVEQNAEGAIRILERAKEEEALVGGQRIQLSAMRSAVESTGLVLRCLFTVEKNELLGGDPPRIGYLSAGRSIGCPSPRSGRDASMGTSARTLENRGRNTPEPTP